jgi:uncharacterized protein (DUF3084 family)
MSSEETKEPTRGKGRPKLNLTTEELAERQLRHKERVAEYQKRPDVKLRRKIAVKKAVIRKHKSELKKLEEELRKVESQKNKSDDESSSSDSSSDSDSD